MQPTPYTPTTDFSEQEAINASGRSTVGTAAVDAEFANLQTTISQILANLAIIQRDDTTINDNAVHPHAFASDSLLLMAGSWMPKGAWITATAYEIGDVVTDSGKTCVCSVAHTSGTFATDLAANKWLVIFESGVVIASGISFTPAGGISSTNVQAALQELDSEKMPNTTVPIAMGGTGSTSATNACVALGIPAKHQSQTYTAFSSAGSSPNLTVTTSPAYGSLVANQRMRIAFHVGSSGADTLNRDATGSASLKQYDSTGTKIDAVFAAGQLADVEYDGTDYVILNPLSPSIAEVEVAGVVTGSMSDYIGSTAPDGYVLASGRTIGNAASGGTERANADTSALFALLWNSMANSEASVSSGRGASAAADFAANKTIALPDLRGRSTAGKDNMGGTTASRLTSGGSGITGTTLGAAGGTETHTLTAGQSGLPSHGHSISATYITGGVTGLLGAGGGSEGLGTPSIGSAGPTSASSAHQNTQPTYIVNKIIKLRG